ncbi:MAG: hypothetical protein AAFU67_18795 [Bacteroidota bacterium]
MLDFIDYPMAFIQGPSNNCNQLARINHIYLALPTQTIFVRVEHDQQHEEINVMDIQFHTSEYQPWRWYANIDHLDKEMARKVIDQIVSQILDAQELLVPIFQK